MNKGLLQKHAELLGLTFRLADLAVIVLGGLLAYWLRFDQLEVQKQYQFAISLVTILALVSFPAFGLYQPWRGASLWEEIRLAALAWAAVVAGCLVLTYLTKTGELYSRIWFGMWFIFVLTALTIARTALRIALRRLRERGYNTRSIVILGAGKLGRHIAETLKKESWTGLKVLGFFDDDPSLAGTNMGGYPVLGTLDEARDFVDRTRLTHDPSDTDEAPTHADQVWIALPLSAERRIRAVVTKLNQTTADIHLVPDIFGYELLNQSMDEIAGLPLLNLSASPIAGRDLMVKEVEDRLLSSLILLLISPLMLLIAIAIKLTSPGPAIFKQRRYGLDGREILVWKFRTMNVWEDGDDIPQACRGDSRVTRLGRFLRRTSLDELPQLINVLQGTMSLVGPRPHAVAHNEEYREIVGRYMLRHKVKPGLTGWAQVNGWRGETDTVEKMERRIEHDLWYIRNWSIWLDLKLILKTIVVSFRDESAY